MVAFVSDVRATPGIIDICSESQSARPLYGDVRLKLLKCLSSWSWGITFPWESIRSLIAGRTMSFPFQNQIWANFGSAWPIEAYDGILCSLESFTFYFLIIILFRNNL